MQELLIAIVGAQAFFNFIQFLIVRRDKRKMSPERLMLLAMGAYRLKVLLKRWKNSEVRTASEWEIIDMLYRGYIKLGGNGEIKKLYTECSKIPTTE